MTRWLANAWLSKIKLGSMPRSTAISTVLCAESTGVITRCGPFFQTQPFACTGAHADAAAQAKRCIDACFAQLWMVGIVGRYQRHCLDRASSDTLAAAVAVALVHHRQVIGSLHGVGESNAAGSDHGFAAASAAVADEVDPVLHVLAKLHQAAVARLLQQVQPLCHVHCAGVTVAGECCARAVKRHTDIHGRIASPAHMHHLMPAVADAHAAMAGRTHNFAGSFVVQHGQRAVCRQRFLVDKGTAQAACRS